MADAAKPQHRETGQETWAEAAETAPLAMDTPDLGMTDELNDLVAKVTGGFNASDAAGPEAPAAIGVESAAGASDLAFVEDDGPNDIPAPGAGGGGIQPAEPATHPDPGPPLAFSSEIQEDTAPADIPHVEDMDIALPVDDALMDEAGDEDEAGGYESDEWLFVEIPEEELESVPARDTAPAPVVFHDEATVDEAGIAAKSEKAPATVGGPVTGSFGAPLPLEIGVEPGEDDGDDVLTVTIDRLPPGAKLSAGKCYPDGLWQLQVEDLPGLHILPAAGWREDFEIEVTATQTDPSSGESSSVSELMRIEVNGDTSTAEDVRGPADFEDQAAIAEPPADAARPATAATDGEAPPAEVQSDFDAPEAVDESDRRFSLNLDAALIDTDGSERITLLINGLPEGGVLNRGKRGPNGTWLLAPEHLDDLFVELPDDAQGDFTLRAQVIATERGTSAASTVLSDMRVMVEHRDGAFRATALNARTERGDVEFEPGEPGRITITSDVTGERRDDVGPACFVALPAGYQVTWISPGVDVDDRWELLPQGGGVLDLSDFVTEGARLNWTFGLQAGMRAAPARSADFKAAPSRDAALALVRAGTAKRPPEKKNLDDARAPAPAASSTILRGGGGEDRRSGGAGEVPPAGAVPPAAPAATGQHAAVPESAPEPVAPEPETVVDEAPEAMSDTQLSVGGESIIAGLRLTRGEVVDADERSVTLSSDAAGSIELRGGDLKIEGVRGLRW